MTPQFPHSRVLQPCPLIALSALALTSLCAVGQTQTPTQPRSDQNSIQVFHLVNVAQANDANEIITTLRNMADAHNKMYLLNSTNDVVVSAPPDQMSLISRLISELDVPKPSYRLTYTLSESDSGKRVGVQHFAVVVVIGQQVTLKQGDKVPVVTGNSERDSAGQQTHYTYVDVGLNVDATLDRFANGLRLRSKVEQSSVAAPQTASSGQDPIIRQTTLQGTSVIYPGKPQILGSIDIVGSTRHVDIEVVAEPLP